MGDKSPKNKEKRKKKQDNKKKPNVPASVVKTLEKKQGIAIGKDVDRMTLTGDQSGLLVSHQRVITRFIQSEAT